MLPILDPADPVAARGPARALGLAFQLTNFIRDVAEDVRRGRVYLPRRDLARFGVTRGEVERAAATRTATPALRALVAYEIGRARAHYAAAATGLPLLGSDSRTCIHTALHLYGAILDEVERAGHDVFRRRAVVPAGRRLRVVARCLLDRPGRAAVTGTGPARAACAKLDG